MLSGNSGLIYLYVTFTEIIIITMANFDLEPVVEQLYPGDEPVLMGSREVERKMRVMFGASARMECWGRMRSVGLLVSVERCYEHPHLGWLPSQDAQERKFWMSKFAE